MLLPTRLYLSPHHFTLGPFVIHHQPFLPNDGIPSIIQRGLDDFQMRLYIYKKDVVEDRGQPRGVVREHKSYYVLLPCSARDSGTGWIREGNDNDGTVHPAVLWLVLSV